MTEPQLTDVTVAFVSAMRVEADQEALAAYAEGNGGYRWESDDTDSLTPRPARTEVGSPLDEYVLVEEFFLSKQIYRDVRQQLLPMRMLLDEEITIEIPLDDATEGRTLRVEPQVVLSYFPSVEVLTATVNFEIPEITVDELIFLKSLKWISRVEYGSVPRTTVEIGDRTDQVTFSEVFQRLVEATVGDLVEIKLPSDAVLDSVEIRGGETEGQLFQGAQNDALFGIITGDEGYRHNAPDMVEQYFEQSAIEIHYRHYFRYFYGTTSLVGLFSEEYPDDKLALARTYRDRFGEISPQSEYIRLVSEFANLSDGHLITAEIALIRYVVLRFIDKELARRINLGSSGEDSPDGQTLDELLDLKQRIDSELTDIDLLTNSGFWVNLPTSIDSLFGYDDTRSNLERKLQSVDDTIQDRYNKRLQRTQLYLTIISVFLTILLTIIAVLRFV
jgi:hypothetical protein